MLEGILDQVDSINGALETRRKAVSRPATVPKQIAASEVKLARSLRSILVILDSMSLQAQSREAGYIFSLIPWVRCIEKLLAEAGESKLAPIRAFSADASDVMKEKMQRHYYRFVEGTTDLRMFKAQFVLASFLNPIVRHGLKDSKHPSYEMFEQRFVELIAPLLRLPSVRSSEEPPKKKPTRYSAMDLIHSSIALDFEDESSSDDSSSDDESGEGQGLLTRF